MDTLSQDVRYALRGIARRPVVAAGVVLSLAIGIAATTAIFSVANGVLLRPVPGIARSERLVEIARDVGGSRADVSYGMYEALRAQRSVLDGLAAFVTQSVSLAPDTPGATPALRGALLVTPDYFAMLGVRPVRGRLFSDTETRLEDAAPVVLVSYELWQRVLAGRDDVAGAAVRINGASVHVVGVLPPGFAGHHTGLLADVFIPLGLTAPGLPDVASLRGSRSSVELLGRLRAGVSAASATRILDPVADAAARQIGETTGKRRYALAVDKWSPLPAEIRSIVGVFLSVLFALAVLALCMACMNVSTLLLAQASERQRELAVRRALGASEGRLARQLVTEVGILFIIAGGLGATAAAWATSLVGRFEAPVPVPGRLGVDVSADGRVILFAIGVTLVAALVFTLAPAFEASRFRILDALREAGASDTRRRVRARSALVGAQVALTTVLLAAMVLFGRALAHMRAIDPGWRSDDVLVAAIDLEMNGTTRERGLVTQRRLLEAITAIPGVEVAALATKLPIGGRSSFGLVTAPGVEAPAGMPGFAASVNRVSGGYFSVMRIPLTRGRDIAATDDEHAPRVAVVNETMARRLWPNVDPIGRHFSIAPPSPRAQDFVVIGVARDAQRLSAGAASETFYYVPAAQIYNSAVVFHVRARPGLTSAVSASMRDAFRRVDPSLPPPDMRPLDDALETYLMPQRLAAWVSGSLGTFGLLLALVGIYGTTAFLVSRRAREMAIRMALGATDADVLRLLLRSGGRAPAAGLVIGALLAAALMVVASKAVAGARSFDPVVIATVPAILIVTATLATLAPARGLLRTSLAARLRDD
jgi:putative ABC transport system permease protein